MKELIQKAVNAGFLNIDIDASTLVDLDNPNLEEQQANNSLVTADMTRYIRDIELEGVTICIGAEIGEVGKHKSS